MKLVRTSIANGIAVGIKLLTAVGLNKILAVAVGPAGYAVIGQFQNAVTMTTTFAGGVFSTGVTKYTAQYYDDEPRQQTVWRTAFTIAIVLAAAASIGVGLAHRELALLFLKDASYSGVFLWFAATFVFFVLNALLLSILNGKKEIRKFVTINIVGSILGLIVTGILAITWGLYGALVALVVNQSVMCGVSYALCRRSSWFQASALWGRIDRGAAVQLAKFAMLSLTSAVVMPLSQILMREHLAGAFGWNAAGEWQAVTKISDLYLMLVTTTLSVYYLPRLSEIRDPREMRAEIVAGYRIILPITIVGASTIFLLRDWIVPTLFSPQFAGMRNLFAWQLAGDVVKIASVLLGYILLGQAMVSAYIITEVLFGACLVGMTMLLTPLLGLRGATAAFCLTYVLHWFAMVVLVGRKLKNLRLQRLTAAVVEDVVIA